MAIDKKSEHVGDHQGRYTDENGMTKQFTYIDHDKKVSIPVSKSDNKNLAEDLKTYRKQLIKRILSISPSVCPFEWQDFTIRGEEVGIKWNNVMLENDGLDINKLQSLINLLENRMDLI